MFRLTAPLEPSFLPTVFVQGIVATLFFGWLPLYLPELFPVQVRATGAGLSMNIGRFVTAARRALIGSQFKGDYSDIGAAVCADLRAGNGRRLLGAEYGRKAALSNARGRKLLHCGPIVVARAADGFAVQVGEVREQTARFRHKIPQHSDFGRTQRSASPL